MSARLFSETAAGLAERGWRVTARPSNRTWKGGSAALPRKETWLGVRILRVWRPAWLQASNLGRLLNAMWMLTAWSGAALFSRRKANEVMIVGTDPILAVLAALPWKCFRPRARIVHWCYDLYPDAAVADGLLKPNSWPVRLLARLTRAAYRHCDFVADLGTCMAQRLQTQLPELRCKTMTTWALVEPPNSPAPDPAVRQELFGVAKLALLYSGSFGRAHSHEEFLQLARRLRGTEVEFCFAGRGNRAEALRAAREEQDTNIRFAGFAPQEQLEKRLTACDIHLVSLRPEWTGMVVPSKFFGALAVGRAVLFAGSLDSAIAGWIRQHQVGWVITLETVDEVAAELRELAIQPDRQTELREHCHRVYHEHFSRQRVLDRWDTELRQLL